MAHFAEIDKDGTVLQVIKISNLDAPDPAPSHSEPLGQAFISDVLGLPGEWRQTSYNGTFRKRYAPVGGRYFHDDDVFVWPRPYPSWSLDENYDWQAPVPMPSEGGPWTWDEDTLDWVEAT